MACKDQWKITTKLMNQVGGVGQNDGWTAEAVTGCNCCCKVVVPGKGIVNTKDSNWAAPRRFIRQYSYSGFAKSGPDCAGGRPMVVIAKHGNYPEPRP